MTKARTVYIIHNTAGTDPEERLSEEEILLTAQRVRHILDEQGRKTVARTLTQPLSEVAAFLEAIPRGSTVFNLFEGFSGESQSEVQVGLLLSSLGLRATGCPPLSMHLGLYKDLCKQILAGAGLPTADCTVLRTRADADRPLPFPFPAFLKPVSDDASLGIGPENLVNSDRELRKRAAEMLRRFPRGLLVEPFLDGREFNCSVVESPRGFEVLPPSMVDYSELPPGHPPVLTYAAKWHTESEVFMKTPTICPAPVEEEKITAVQDLALKAFKLIRCRGYARVDLREDAAGALHVLEVNPNPDISPNAGLAKQARTRGLSYDELILQVVAAAEEGEPWTSR